MQPHGEKYAQLSILACPAGNVISGAPQTHTESEMRVPYHRPDFSYARMKQKVVSILIRVRKGDMMYA